MELPLSTFGARCGPNQTIQLVTPFFNIPDVAMLAQGAPPPAVFPIKAISLSLADGTVVQVEAPAVDDAQTYLYARAGYAPLTHWCTAFFRKHHRPPRETTAVALSAGTTDAIATLTQVLIDPGEVCLTEEFTWGTALDGMRSRGIVLAGVRIDEHGLVPESLERECARLRAEGLTPRALYIVPNGSNPGGTTLAPERFARVYAICLAHRVCIIEDDPYWWLALGEGAPLPGPSKSFASIDTAGIVVRLDSFAKSIAPGLRLGWISGPPHIVRAFNGASSTSTHNGSPFAMVALHAVLAHWGDDGLNRHIEGVRAEYRRRMRVMLDAADAELKGLATWTRPSVGMFVWCDLTPSRVTDASALLPALLAHRVLAIPAANFSPAACKPDPHMRLSFASAPDAEMVAGVQRLAAVLRAHRESAPAG